MSFCDFVSFDYKCSFYYNFTVNSHKPSLPYCNIPYLQVNYNFFIALFVSCNINLNKYNELLAGERGYNKLDGAGMKLMTFCSATQNFNHRAATSLN